MDTSKRTLRSSEHRGLWTVGLVQLLRAVRRRPGLSRRVVLSLFAALAAAISAASMQAYLRIQAYQRRLAAVEERVRGQEAQLLPRSPTLCPEETLKQYQHSADPALADPAKDLERIARFNDDGLVFATSGRAVLLQLAHPYIAQGVHDHSALSKDPQGATAMRFFRTFGLMFPIWFGTDEHRQATLVRWRALHRRVKGVLTDNGGPFKKGDEYSAADLRATWWVQATLTENIVAYWHMMSPERATEDNLEAYWRLQARRTFLVVGIPPEMIPNSYREFEEEYVRVWADLGVTSAARTVVALLQSAGRNNGPLSRYMIWSTFEKSMPWLPPALKDQFGIFPLWRRIYGQLALSVDLGLVTLFRGFVQLLGFDRVLELSYFVDMRRRSGERISAAAEALYFLGRNVALFALWLILGGFPKGLRPDWT